MPKLCLVGLGNPGSKYNNTRHNIGKDWLLAASANHCSSFSYKEKFQAEISTSHSDEILWVIPDNYVNNSGKTVLKLMKNMNIKEDKMIIFHDDLDLNPGEVRLKEDGGHGGHNGLRDIFEKVGSRKFLRLRIGVGHPGNKDMVSSWVLNKFNPTDKKYVDMAYDKFVSVLDLIFNDELSEAQKSLHTK